MISETSHRLNGIFKLCTTQADICVQPDIDVELISNDTVAESILWDFDTALVTVSFYFFSLRFNLCVTSFLNKVVSQPQSNKLLVFMKVCPFDSFTKIICRKVCFAPYCAFTDALLGSNTNEVIRSVLNFLFYFIFFYDKISQVQKSANRIQGTKKYQKALKSIKTQSI